MTATTNPRSTVLNVRDYGAKGDGSTDDHVAIQSVLDRAGSTSVTPTSSVVYFPPGIYPVSARLTVPGNIVIRGCATSGYPYDATRLQVSTVKRANSMNDHVFYLPRTSNYVHFHDLVIDGNNTNNTTGYGVFLDDETGTTSEAQILIDGCFIHHQPGSGIYLGLKRRTTKIRNSILNINGIDGVTVAGTDTTIQSCVIGTNTRAGIALGTTITQNWAATNPGVAGIAQSAAVAHVTGCDIFVNKVAIAVAKDSWGVNINGNGMDRNKRQAVTVYNGDGTTIAENSFHSNSQEADNGYPHIDIATDVTQVTISDNNFLQLDGDTPNLPSMAVHVANPATTVFGTGNKHDTGGTKNGLFTDNTAPFWTSLSGATVQGVAASDVARWYMSDGTLVAKIGQFGALSTFATGTQLQASSSHVVGSNTGVSNSLISFINSILGNTMLALKAAASQTGDLIRAYASDGTTVLFQVDKSGNVIAPSVTYQAGPVSLAGAGSPEGSVTAPVGSTYQRSDGGADTTLYTKESGAGNTGWVARGSVTSAMVTTALAAATFTESQVTNLTTDLASSSTVSDLATPPQRPTLLTMFQTGHGWTGGGTGGSVNLNNTSDYMLGSQSVSVTTDGAGHAKWVNIIGRAAVDMTGKVFRVWAKVDDITNLTNLFFYAGNSSFASFYQWQIQAGAAGTQNLKYVQSGEWVSFTLGFEDAIISGTPTKSGLTDFRFYLQDNAAGAVTGRINGWATVADASNVWTHGVVSLNFDDNYLTQYTIAKPYLDQYAYQASAFPIIDTVGASNHMTIAQLQALQNQSGWEIGAHATTSAIHNAGYPSLSTSALDTECVAMRSWLAQNQFKGYDTMAWPGGLFSQAAEQQARRYFISARTIYSNQKETWLPGNPYRLRCLAIGSTTSVATIKAEIDSAYTNKSWLILLWHEIVASGASTSTQTNTADLQSIIDYLNTKGIPVRTIGDVMRTPRPEV